MKYIHQMFVIEWLSSFVASVLLYEYGYRDQSLVVFTLGCAAVQLYGCQFAVGFLFGKLRSLGFKELDKFECSRFFRWFTLVHPNFMRLIYKRYYQLEMFVPAKDILFIRQTHFLGMLSLGLVFLFANTA